MAGMAPFTSKREGRLWVSALAVLVGIYASAAAAGSLVEVLRDERLLGIGFAAAFVIVIAAVFGIALSRAPRASEIWVGLGVAAVYGMIVVRMGVSPIERTHLFEYGLLAAIVYAALAERQRNGGRVPAPAAITVAATALAGWIDEGLQARLPDRVYDLRDVGVNALAALVATAASVLLARLRQRAPSGEPRRPGDPGAR
ncbi:MAG: hypothetical protein AMS19_09195 [Gemmatimonas sp. SG8_23]|nr:MAG: hypothetical protein AMS19_09195 [Gemmatimonas sp. SG8_23]